MGLVAGIKGPWVSTFEQDDSNLDSAGKVVQIQKDYEAPVGGILVALSNMPMDYLESSSWSPQPPSPMVKSLFLIDLSYQPCSPAILIVCHVHQPH